MVNPFVNRIAPRNESWIWPVSGMSLVIGFMFSLVWVTEKNRQSRYELLEPTQKTRVSEATLDLEAATRMRDRLNYLENQNTKLQNTLGQGKTASTVLNEELQEAKLAAAQTPVEGPGVIVTLKDSPHGELKVENQTIFTPDKNIHDLDVLRIVNELFASGAEAVSVNDYRIGAGSTIRCVGPTILIDDVKVAPPIVVKAIGDSKTLEGGLNLNGGILSEIRSSDPDMVQIEDAKSLKLDPFTGRPHFKFGKVPKVVK